MFVQAFTQKIPRFLHKQDHAALGFYIENTNLTLITLFDYYYYFLKRQQQHRAATACVEQVVPERFPSWERMDGAQRVLALSFGDFWHFSAENLFHRLKQAAGSERAQTAAPAGTTNVLSTPGGKQCVTAIPTVRKQETVARTIRAFAKYLVSCLLC